MILANVAAAETLERAHTPLVYRVHDEPTVEKLHALREFLATLDISLPKAGALRPEHFNRILERVKGRDTEKLVNEIVLRSQAQAEYAAENYGHFGLNLRRYAHFTSPIRRYADLIVHRALIRALKLGDGGLPNAEDARSLGETAAKISAAERRAMAAERETVDRLIAHFLADRIGATFDGPHRRRHPLRPVRQARRHRRRRLHSGAPPSATNISAITSAPMRWSAMRSGETHRLGDPRLGAPRRSRPGRRRAALRAALGRRRGRRRAAGRGRPTRCGAASRAARTPVLAAATARQRRPARKRR